MATKSEHPLFVLDDQQQWHRLAKGQSEHDGRASCGLKPPAGYYWWAGSNVCMPRTGETVHTCASRWRE